MKIPLQVTFRNMPSSKAVEAAIREKAAKLDQFYDKIMGCRVIVEAPHRRHHKGKRYHVRIDLTVPRGELVIKREPKRIAEAPSREPEGEPAETREPSKYGAHDDIYVAVRDAFDAARRKLQDYARRQRGGVKIHEPEAQARVSKLFPEEGFGFLEALDGKEIYFHRNSVLEPGFDHLRVGSKVTFAEELGEKGPQASTVRFMGKHSLPKSAI
ncbi:MAG: HPF/RaiA family ribosome-associated protein [Candidatus Binatia bacterium]